MIDEMMPDHEFGEAHSIRLSAPSDHTLEAGKSVPLEKLVLEYAQGITRTPAVVEEDLFSALRERLGEAQLVEITAAIAWKNYRARFNHAFGMGSQGFSEGMYCPLPEALAGDSREAG